MSSLLEILKYINKVIFNVSDVIIRARTSYELREIRQRYRVIFDVSNFSNVISYF